MAFYEKDNKKGFCLVFNHRNYCEELSSENDDLTRYGTESDVANIEDAFKNHLGFEYLAIHDATLKTIFGKVAEVFSKIDDYSSIFIFILTHGNQDDELYAYDCTYDLKELINECTKGISQEKFTKPLVFVIQACAGDEPDHGISEGCSSMEVDGCSFDDKADKFALALPAIPHVLLARSSPPGFLSFRNWFIFNLCKAIKQYSHEHDLQVLLTLAKREVSKMTAVDKTQKYKQIPISVSTLTKKLKLQD